jgi:hypothetical protein
MFCSFAEAKAEFREKTIREGIFCLPRVDDSYAWAKVDIQRIKDQHEAKNANIVMLLSTLIDHRGGKPRRKKARARKQGGCDVDGDPVVEEVKKMRDVREETKWNKNIRNDKFHELEKSKLELEWDRQGQKDNANIHEHTRRRIEMVLQVDETRDFGSRFGSSQP